MAVGLPPTAVSMSGAIGLAAQAPSGAAEWQARDHGASGVRPPSLAEDELDLHVVPLENKLFRDVGRVPSGAADDQGREARYGEFHRYLTSTIEEVRTEQFHGY